MNEFFAKPKPLNNASLQSLLKAYRERGISFKELETRYLKAKKERRVEFTIQKKNAPDSLFLMSWAKYLVETFDNRKHVFAFNYR